MSAGRKKQVGIVSIGLAILVSTTLLLRYAFGSGAESESLAPPDASNPSGSRVRVQVLNATTTRGLARRATILLRDKGFDVVEMGTASERLDSTLVLDMSGHPDRARRVAGALGGARVQSRPDSSRYLDVTVLLGRSFRPPAEPFHP